MTDGIAIIERVHKRGASVKALDRDYLDLTKTINRGILAFLSALAEDERHRILKRGDDGRTAAKAKGTWFGRKPKLTAHQQAEALKRLAAGESCRSIARTMNHGRAPRHRRGMGGVDSHPLVRRRDQINHMMRGRVPGRMGGRAESLWWWQGHAQLATQSR